MKSLKHIALLTATFLSLYSFTFAFNITLELPDGGSVTLEVPEDSTLDTLYKSALSYAEEKYLGFRLVTDNAFILDPTGPLPVDEIGEDSLIRLLNPEDLIESFLPRDYYAEIEEGYLSALHDIIRTLSTTPIPLLLLKRNELDRKGRDLDAVHPLKLVKELFTDEKLKVGIRTMKKKKRVWTEWITGLSVSLDLAADQENITKEMAEDLGRAIDLDPQHFWAQIQKRDWKRFMNILVTRVPRSSGGNGHRYD